VIERAKGAAAGGGVGALGMLLQAIAQYTENAQRAVVEIASQESYLELLSAMMEKCGGG
jgi:hypothetical protein